MEKSLIMKRKHTSLLPTVTTR